MTDKASVIERGVQESRDSTERFSGPSRGQGFKILAGAQGVLPLQVKKGQKKALRDHLWPLSNIKSKENKAKIRFQKQQELKKLEVSVGTHNNIKNKTSSRPRHPEGAPTTQDHKADSFGGGEWS